MEHGRCCMGMEHRTAAVPHVVTRDMCLKMAFGCYTRFSNGSPSASVPLTAIVLDELCLMLKFCISASRGILFKVVVLVSAEYGEAPPTPWALTL